MKKKILIILLLSFLLTGCLETKKRTNIIEHSLSDIVEEEIPDTIPGVEINTNPEPSPPVVTPPVNCTPKKFNKTYTYIYDTKDKCVSEGGQAYMSVHDNIDSTIFSFGCEAIADECGTKWYGIYFNTKNEETGEIVRKYY